MLCERLRYRCASVAYEDVAAPERDDGIAQRPGIRHIGADIPGIERAGSPLESDGIATDQRDSGPIGTKAACNGKPDPLGPAGDHGSETAQRLWGMIAHI